MSEKMLVTQALDERDLLVKKISDKIDKASFVDTIKPNEDTNLKKILAAEENNDRALLISATGERGIFVTGGRNPGFTRVSEAWS